MPGAETQQRETRRTVEADGDEIRLRCASRRLVLTAEPNAVRLEGAYQFLSHLFADRAIRLRMQPKHSVLLIAWTTIRENKGDLICCGDLDGAGAC